MRETIDAIYENGVLRPLHKLSMLEGQKIRIVVEKDTTVDRAGVADEEDRYDLSELAGCLSSSPRFSADPVAVADEERLWLTSVSRNPAFAFLSEPEEDIYGPHDGTPLND